MLKKINIILFLMISGTIFSEKSVENCRFILKKNNLDMAGGQLLLLEYLLKVKYYTEDHRKACICLFKSNQKIHEQDSNNIPLNILITKIITVLNSTKFEKINQLTFKDIKNQIIPSKFRFSEIKLVTYLLMTLDQIIKSQNDELVALAEELKSRDIQNIIMEHEHHYIYYQIDIEGKIKEIAKEYGTL